jgi:hypothetical protein
VSGTVSKELRPLLRAVRAAGWEERPGSRGKGIVVYPPNGMPPIGLHGSTHGKGRVVAEKRAKLRRAGLEV